MICWIDYSLQNYIFLIVFSSFSGNFGKGIFKKNCKFIYVLDFEYSFLYNDVNGDFNGNDKTAKRTISGIENARSDSRMDKMDNVANENNQITTSTDEILRNNKRQNRTIKQSNIQNNRNQEYNKELDNSPFLVDSHCKI